LGGAIANGWEFNTLKWDWNSGKTYLGMAIGVAVSCLFLASISSGGLVAGAGATDADALNSATNVKANEFYENNKASMNKQMLRDSNSPEYRADVMSNFPSYNNLGTPEIIVGPLQYYGWTSDNITIEELEATIGGKPQTGQVETRFGFCGQCHNPNSNMYYHPDLVQARIDGLIINIGINMAVGGIVSAELTLAELANSGSIMRSLGAASRAEMLASKLKLNINSPVARQVLNSLDEPVESFITTYRKASIRSVFPGEYLNMTVEEALRSGNTTVRKLLIDGRFVK